jgi:thiosulfate/3-mercaptopyruvate sulfurtransferase
MLKKIVQAGVVIGVYCAMGAAAALASDLVVDSKFVQNCIGRSDCVILDTRTAEEYNEGHIPGAVNLGKLAAKALRDPTHRAYTIVPAIEKSLGNIGIADDRQIVIYGKAVDTYYTTVAFWILEYLGCNSSPLKCTAHYYDGGIEQWELDNGKLEQKPTVLPKAAFKARAVPSRLATTEEVLSVVTGKEKAVLIDTRTEAEFNGAEIRALRGGHVPGALHIKVQKNYDEKSNRMLSLAEVGALYKDIPSSARVIAYCQTGTRSTYTYLVLRLLGYQNVASYDDSWRVYGSNVNYPAESEQWFDFIEVNQATKDVKELRKELDELQHR